MSTTKVTGMMQTATKGGDISSASPTVIDTDGDYFDVTGTTNFAAFTVVAGRRFTVQFDGILTMTHHATNLDLPGAANITTAAGDVAEFFATATNTVQCVNYTKADGTAVVSSAGGDRRNFIIDGDFTQWPEGDRSAVNTQFGPALWKHRNVENDQVTVDMTQSATVPTVAQSGHLSESSFLFDINAAESALAADEWFYLQYIVTGTDFSSLHQQEVTLNWWTRSTTTGTYHVCFTNSAQDRSYPASYTISLANTWEEKTITLTLDTSGTWLTDSTEKGLQILFTYAAGSDYEGTANSWQAGIKTSASGAANLSASTSNNLYISQIGLYLGSTAPTSFLSPPLATIIDQVSWYVQRYNFDIASGEFILSGKNTTGTGRGAFPFLREMRIAPSITSTAAATFDWVEEDGTVNNATAILYLNITKFRFVPRLAASGMSTQGGYITRDGTDTCYFHMDARH